MFPIAPVVLISLCFTLTSAAIAQPRTLADSLLEALAQTGRDTLHLRLLHRLVRYYWRNQPDSVLHYAEQMHTLASQLKDKRGLADAHNAISYVYERWSDFPKALAHRWQALSLYDALGDKTGIAWCYHSLGNIYDYQGKYDSALSYHIRALALREEMGDAQGICWSLNRIGDCYANQGKHHLALSHRTQALEKAEALNAQDAICSSLVGVAMSYFALGEYEAAKRFALRGLEIAETLGDKRYTDLALTTLGECARVHGHYDDALRYFRKGLQLREEMQVQNYIAESLERIGYVLLLQKKHTEAVQFATRSLELASRIQAQNEARAAAKLLSDIYRDMGDYKTALAYYERFSALKDSLLSLERQKHIAELQLRLETERKDREIERLQREAEAKTTVQRLLLALALLLLIVAGLIALSYWQKVRQNQTLSALNAELRKARENADVARQAAEQADAFKTELLSIAAHDLRNPLQSIAGFAMLLREKQPASDDVTAMIDAILHASQRMLRLITGLLKTTALDAGSVELEKSLVDIGMLLKSVVEANQPNAAQKMQRIELQLAPNLYTEVDASRMREVFENLISNAMKYSLKQSTIWVEARRYDATLPSTSAMPASACAQPQHITTSVHTELLPYPTILISVRDEGQGLSADDMKKLFGKFQRLSARPTGGEDSTGLGLSIVKKLVEIHGGKVWATSEGKDKGSSFFVALPATK